MNRICKFTTQNGTDAGVEYFKVYADGSTQWNANSNTQQILTVKDVNVNDVLRVYGNGKVIIGTQSVVGTHSDALLQVAGKAAAKSFYVLKPTTWADDEFLAMEKPDIKKIEHYISENRHLPGVPSEAEIQKEGYNVHEMNVILLRKIEELYKIVIAQQKEIEELKKREK